MKTRTSKLLTTEGNEFYEGTSHYATGVSLDFGNNPSSDQLYRGIAESLRDFIECLDLFDTVTVLYSHNYSHFCGKVKQTFSVSDLCDYL